MERKDAGTMAHCRPVLMLLVFSFTLTVTLGQISNIPPLTGAGNNVGSPSFGQAGTTYEFHFVSPDFADNISSPAGGHRPSARKVSEEIHSLPFQYGLHGINDLLPYFGQFICHDIALSPDDPALPLDIQVDSCDEGFDSCCAGNKTISFARSQGSLSPNGYRVTYNGVTTWVDASTVYGSDAVWNSKLRTTVDGLLKVSQGPHGDLLPLNDIVGLDMAPGSGHVNALFAAGDARANVNLPMVCLHTLFHLEHNAVARSLKSTHPTWSDQDLFDEARKYVVALMQYTLYYVYVPLLIGKTLPAYQGYDSSLDPSIDTAFMTSAFRYGHSTTNKEVLLYDSEMLPVKTGHLDIGKTIFNPSEIMNNGMDNILRGILLHSEAEADLNVPKQLRNHDILLDLAAKDIQRGRDRGLPSFNDIREQLGFPRYTNWSQLTQDSATQQALASVYANVDDLDALVGGLAEAPENGALVSPTFVKLIELQFDRLRAADRFHFENPDVLDATIRDYAQTRKLGGLVRDHTGFSDAPDNMFAMKEPSSGESCGGGGSTGEGASEVHTVEALPGLSFSWSTDLANEEITIELALAVDSTGWIGIGFNSQTMRGADVVLVHQPSVGTFQADDMHVPETGALVPVLDAESNIDPLRTSGSYIDGVLTVNFTRPLQTSDSTDAVLDPASTEVQLIFAYGTSPGAYHGIGNRAALSIALFSEDTAVVGGGGGPNLIGVYAVHGAIMLLMWMVFTPLSIMVARYKRHWAYSMEIHQTLSQAGTIGVVSFAVSAFVASSSPQVGVHALIGLGVVAILLLQLILGWSTRLLLVNSHKVSAIKKGKFWHKLVGIFLAIMAIVNCFLGIQLLFGSDGWLLQLLCISYLSVLAAWAAYLELGKAKLGYKKARKDKQKANGRVEPYLLNDSDRQLSTAAALMKNLPQMTFHDVTVKVSAGSLLIVINSKVYDIRQFITKHPGGQRTLEEFIGTDATSVFYGLVDDSHTHSGHALNLLDNYLIARLMTDEDAAQRRGSLLPTLESKYNLFRFATILDKTELNQAKDVVVLFTLKWEDSAATAPKGIQIGQHYRVLATYEGAGLSRYYTPLDTTFNDGTMQFAIKSYENGRMSSFLRKQPVGTRIRIQGPYGKDLSNPLMTLPDGCYKQLVLFAGGSGITTHISIIRHHLRHAKGQCKIWLLFANSSTEDVFLVDVLKDLSLSFDGDLKVFLALSKATGEMPPHLQSFTVFSGRMNEEKIKQMEIPRANSTPREDGTIAQQLTAVCGPRPFCEAISRLLAEHSGYNPKDIQQQY